MAKNPLFKDYSNSDGQLPGGADAAELIRQKVSALYAEEPNASEELREADSVVHQSKHQRFMYDLGTSGKDLASIQTEWHNYYQGLSDSEKHQVWQEFYSSRQAVQRQPAPTQPTPDTTQAVTRPQKRARKLRDVRSIDEVRSTIKHNVSAGGKLSAKHHIQSLLFGIGMGTIVMVVVLFGLFNEVVLAPLYQPSRHASATPLIIDPNSVAPTDKNEVIIPKINLEIPVDNTQTTTDESTIQTALENGIVHYPTTANPGEIGNASYFGHSSSNIFNKGKFKFAFVLLHAVTPGDTFYITYNKKVFVYKVITRTIVDPGDVGVLDPIPGQSATATLITCDPPGTSLRRLVIVGQQISPDPTANSASAVQQTNVSTTPLKLPGNGQTLAGRLIQSTTVKAAIVVLCFACAVWAIRRLNR